MEPSKHAENRKVRLKQRCHVADGIIQYLTADLYLSPDLSLSNAARPYGGYRAVVGRNLRGLRRIGLSVGVERRRTPSRDISMLQGAP